MTERKHESGSALLMGALSIFFVVVAILAVAHVGWGISKKTRMQTAADAAALAGAEVLANSMSSISWINNGMSLIYYNLTLMSKELAAASILACLDDGWVIDEHSRPLPAPYVSPLPADIKGRAVKKWEGLYRHIVGEEANPGMLPKGQAFIRTLARLERGIAIVTPLIVEKVVHRVAAANGAERVAYYPYFQMYPDPYGEISVAIDRLNEGGTKPGWNLYDVLGYPGFDFDVRVTYSEGGNGRGAFTRRDILMALEPWAGRPKIKATVTKFEEIQPDGIMPYDLLVKVAWEDESSLTDPGQETPNLPSPYPISDDEFKNNFKGRDYYWFKVNTQVDPPTFIPKFTNPTDPDVSVRRNDDGSLTVQKGNNPPMNIRYNEEGMYVNGKLLTAQNTASLGGANVDVIKSLWYPSPRSDVNFGYGRVRVYTKNESVVVGLMTEVTDQYGVSGGTDFGYLDIQKSRVDTHRYMNDGRSELSTADPSTQGVWKLRANGGGDNWTDRDRYYHRLLATPKESYDFLYESRHIGGYLRPDGERMAWRHFDELSQLPAWVYEPDSNPEGWMDIARGEVLMMEDAPLFSKYALQFPCTFPDPHGHQGVADTQFDPADPNTACPVCKNYDPETIPGSRTYYRVFQGEASNRRIGVSHMVSNARSDNHADSGHNPDKIPFTTASLLSSENVPLTLTEELFKYGITVAVWSEHDFLNDSTSSIMSTPTGGTPYPEWGYYAMSGARIGFWDTEADRYRFRFDNADERKEWVMNSPHNMFQPDWIAALYPVRLMIRPEDLNIDPTGDRGEILDDSGINFLMRVMTQTHWRKEYGEDGDSTGFQMRQMKSPWNSQNFDMDSKEVQDVFHH